MKILIYFFLLPSLFNSLKLSATNIDSFIDRDESIVTITGAVGDFSYKQDVCNPLSIKFTSFGISPANPVWLFGDGSSSTEVNPTHLYTVPGTYMVIYVIRNGTNVDSVKKNILIDIIKEDVILTKDTTICLHTFNQLITKPALNFCWFPTNYLSDPLAANPFTNTPAPITYFFTAEITGQNLITNGDFSAGNSGFTSKYVFANPTITEAQYFVGTNPQTWSPLLSPCGDHTTGNGNMMFVNGASIPNVEVWNEIVSVTPNTNYAFSTWIQAMYPPNPAQLSFTINGGDIGNLITPTLPTCTWSRFYTTWNSGNNTSASISIVNKNTAVEGNDFTLDDIVFAPVFILRDSIKISIDSPAVKTIADTASCAGSPIQFNTLGADTYSWSPSFGLSNATTSNPVATPATSTQYVVTGINLKGCYASDTVNILIRPQPIVTKSNDTAICHNTAIQLFAIGGIAYSWSSAETLNSASISKPLASPISNTIYKVTVTGANNCSITDSVKIDIKPFPVFTISTDKTTCINKKVSLSAGGGSSYLWSPAEFLNDPASSNPISNNNNSVTFSVKILDNTCNDSTTLTTKVIVAPNPIITAFKSNDIDCVLPNSQLIAIGANKFVWSPATGLNSNNIFNPIATIKTQQQYAVSGTDTITGCTGSANITLFIKPPFEPSFFVPNAFSPNGDGKNDCFRVRHYGTVKFVDFSIFSRVGNLVFHSRSLNDCWDGTYNGTPLDRGNYVYYIKTFNDCGENVRKGNLILIR